ncbi:MAG: beta-galactosidase, partial [Clostridia bacterium]|nr:beta-galactosidase [Clostridia bacterium]
YEAYLARHPEERASDPDAKYTDTGVLRMMLEGKYLFDVVDGENDLSQYKLVILPDRVKIDDTLRAQLAPCLLRGGKILATGTSGLADGGFAYDLGATYLGARDVTPVYLTPAVENGIAPAGYVHYMPAERIKDSGTVLASLNEAYFNRTLEHFCSHRHAPEKLTDTEAGITVGRDGAYIAVQIFREYAKVGSLSAKQFVLSTIEHLIGDTKRVTVGNFPTGGIVTMMRQKDRTVLHLVYAPRTTKGEKHIEVIEDCVTLSDVCVKVRPTGKVSSVVLVPEGITLPYETEADGAISFVIPKAGIHTMVVLND